MQSAFLQLYADTFDQQAQLLANETISVVTGLSSFPRVHRILDVGCGVGSQLSVLQESFRHKTYLGLDSCEEFIESAKQRFSEPAIQCWRNDNDSYAKLTGGSWLVLEQIHD